MRLSKHHRRPSTSFMNMTPMIDIVFLLIIFYISVYQITHVSDERIELAKLEGIEDKEKTKLTLTVLEDGTIRHQGEDQTVAQIVLMVGQQLAEHGHDTELLSIMIRADRRGNSRTVNELIRQFEQLGITQVRIAVESR